MTVYKKRIKKLTSQIGIMTAEALDCEKKQRKRIINKIATAKTLVHYLESEPSPEFIQAEINRLTRRLDLIAEGFKAYSPPQGKEFKRDTAILKFYNKEYDVPHLKAQLKALKELIN